jgi:hypothetical protein
MEPIPTPSNPAAQAGAQAPATAAQPDAQVAKPDVQLAPPDAQSAPPDAQPATDPSPPAAAVLAVDAWPVSPSPVPQCEGLSPPQRTALAAIGGGQSLACAAQVAGVSASTLYRWRTKDPAFIAALNAWRGQTNDAVRDRLLAMSDQAALTILGGLRAGDTKLAMALLKLLGAAAPVQIGPATADQAQRILGREDLQEQEQAYDSSRALRADGRRLAERIKSNELWDKMLADPAYQAKRNAEAMAEVERLMDEEDDEDEDWDEDEDDDDEED